MGKPIRRAAVIGDFELCNREALGACEPDRAALYARLVEISPSPVVALNHAVAVAMSEGPERGLARIDCLESSGELSDYYLLHAARADLLRRLGRKLEATEAYTRALQLARNPIEQNYLRRRLAELDFTEG